MEARSFSAERARTLLVKVKEYKADLAALRTELKKARTLSTACRPQLAFTHFPLQVGLDRMAPKSRSLATTVPLLGVSGHDESPSLHLLYHVACSSTFTIVMVGLSSPLHAAAVLSDAGPHVLHRECRR